MLYLSLGLVLSSYVVGFIFFRKYRKTIDSLQSQIEENQKIIDAAPLIFNAKIQEQIDLLELSIDVNYNKINRKLDNRSEASYRYIDTKQQETIKQLKSILTNWENSEEFKMMLNGIKNRERKVDTGVNY